MRVLPLVLILALIGGIGYVYFFHWDYVSRMVRGYRQANTPDEAMANFEKAIKARDYKTASLYCTGDYSDYLKKADEAARNIGRHMDRIMLYMKEQGLERDSSVAALYFFDMFPPYFTQKGVPTKNDKDQKVATGIFEIDALTMKPSFMEDGSLNKSMFTNALTPWHPMQALQPLPAGRQIQVVIKEVDENGNKSWKLDIPLPQARADQINYFVTNYKAYDTGFNQFSTFLTSERLASKQDMETEILKVFHAAKE